jgi:glycosyltransferase involved in cell wall biosynthesis
MPKVLLYTDSDFFAGCENMIGILMNDAQFRHRYDSVLYYRKSALYEEGLSGRLDSLTSCKGLPLIALRRSILPLVIRNNIFFRVTLRLISIVLMPVTFIFNALLLAAHFLSSGKDTIIINNGGYPGAQSCRQAALVARLVGFRKIIMVVNNAAQPPKGFFKILGKLYDTILFWSVNKIITGSEITGLALRHTRGLVCSKSLVIPNGINADRFEAAHVAGRRAKVFNSGNSINFSIVGLHESRKGHLVLLKALKEVTSRRPDLHHRIKVSIEGQGDLTKVLANFVDENNLSASVVFHKHVENISRFYMDTDVLIHPSLFSEDLPNVISEAMLFGIPTIGSNIAGIPSQISDGINGFLLKPGDHIALSQRMETFLDNSEILNAMSKECVAKFNTEFSSDIAVGRYIDLIGGGK